MDIALGVSNNPDDSGVTNNPDDSGGSIYIYIFSIYIYTHTAVGR
jgi:hypothetical protein